MTIFLLSQIRDSPNLKGQVPVFISPRNMVAQLYPQALGFDFEVHTALVMKGIIVWDITQCSPLKVIVRLRGLQGRRISHEGNRHEAGSKKSFSLQPFN
jgi:hypothetical protein